MVWQKCPVRHGTNCATFPDIISLDFPGKLWSEYIPCRKKTKVLHTDCSYSCNSVWKLMDITNGIPNLVRLNLGCRDWNYIQIIITLINAGNAENTNFSRRQKSHDFSPTVTPFLPFSLTSSRLFWNSPIYQRFQIFQKKRTPRAVSISHARNHAKHWVSSASCKDSFSGK